MLGSQAFRQSRGLSKLLRYICGKALVEDSESITEYTIAVDVLGKPQSFRETKDASVRVEVHRLRKRLAEFYEQEGAGHSIRIVIPLGQYVPQFLAVPGLPAAHAAVEPEPEAPVEPALPESAPAVESAPAIRDTGRSWRRLPIAPGRLAGAALAVIAVAAAVRLVWHVEDPLDNFWRPVLSAHNPILLCVGNVEGGKRPRPRETPLSGLSVLDVHTLDSEMMLISDASTLCRLAGLLESKGKRYRVTSQSEATFADLRNSPAVLIGLANNDWTERLVGTLRFTVEHRPPGRIVLVDRDHPERNNWSIDYRMPYMDVTRDYALVVRVLDPKTDQMVVTAAGISVFGTLAAGEFLTDPKEFRKIESVAPKGWARKNFELVLSTDVIRGKSGHANIVASHFW